MTIENDLTRIAVALENLVLYVTRDHQFTGALPAESAETPTPQPDLTGIGKDEPPQPTPAATPQPTAAPTRTRRTKAQIEADKQAEAARILAAMQAQVAGAAAPVVAPIVAPAAAAPAATPGPTFTLADFRPRFVKLADAGKRDDLIALIKSLGGAMLTDVKPEQYNALHAGLVKLEGGHV